MNISFNPAQYKKYSSLFSNFSYMAVLQVFLMCSSLITYPYLVRVLGRELYGVVLTAQVLASYVTLVVGFGSDNVCAKFVSQYSTDSKKLSEIISSILVNKVHFMVIEFCCLFFNRIYNSYL